MGKHKCSICRKELIAIKNNSSKTANRPSRKLSNLCIRCSDRVFRLAKRLKNKEIKTMEVEIRYLSYANQLRDKI